MSWNPAENTPSTRPKSARAPAGKQAPLRAVLFDLDDVLLDGTIWRRWLVQLLARMGRLVHYQHFFREWDQLHLAAVCRGEHSFDNAFRSFLWSSGLTPAQVDEVAAAGLSQCRHLQATLRPFPGVRNTLVRLKQAGCRLAIVAKSPYPAASLRERLQPLALDRYFEAVVSSYDHHEYELSEPAFRAALSELHTAAENAAFVGHDLDTLVNARSAGLCGVAFNFDRDVTADVYMRRFDELVDLIEPSGDQSLERAA